MHEDAAHKNAHGQACQAHAKHRGAANQVLKACPAHERPGESQRDAHHHGRAAIVGRRVCNDGGDTDGAVEAHKRDEEAEELGKRPPKAAHAVDGEAGDDVGNADEQRQRHIVEKAGGRQALREVLRLGVEHAQHDARARHRHGNLGRKKAKLTGALAVCPEMCDIADCRGGLEQHDQNRRVDGQKRRARDVAPGIRQAYDYHCFEQNGKSRTCKRALYDVRYIGACKEVRQEQEDGREAHAERSAHDCQEDDVRHLRRLKKGNRPHHGCAYERPGDGAGRLAEVCVGLGPAIRHDAREHRHGQEERDGHSMRRLGGKSGRDGMEDAERRLQGGPERKGQRRACSWLGMLLIEPQSMRDLTRPLRHRLSPPGPLYPHTFRHYTHDCCI